MKKLMFVLAVMLGVSVNAGTVSWSFWDDDQTASNDYMLYLMEGSLTTGSKIDSIKDATTAKAFVADAAGSGLMDHTDGFYVEGSTGAYAAGAKDFYAVIFNNESIDSATDYKIVGAFTANVPGAGMVMFANDITGLTTSGWSSISGGGSSDAPEPTSGLLLLVGGAMLALRRKQK